MDRQDRENSFDFRHCPWSIKDVFIVFIYSIALFLVFFFWLTFLYFLIHRLGGESLGVFAGLGQYLKTHQHPYVVLLFYAALFCAIKVKIFRKYNINEFTFFIRKNQIGSDMVYGVSMYLKFLAIILFIMFFSFLVTTVWDMVFGTRILQKVNFFFVAYQVEKGVMEERLDGIFGGAILFLAAPLLEELFFRGCFYRALRRRFTPSLAIIVSSLIFSLLHGYFFVFIYVFLLGVLLAYIYEKRKSLVAPVVFHMLNNALVVMLFFI